MLKVKLTKSPIGFHWRQRKTVRALGLNKLNSEKLHDDTPAIRGMIAKVAHLVCVEAVESNVAASKGSE